GLLQHLGIQCEADLLQVPGLLLAQNLPGATYFQVVAGQGKARPQGAGGADGLDALDGIGGHVFLVRCQQVGIGLVVRTPNPAPQLVQLRQAQLVGTIDDDSVGAGDVDAGFDDGRAHQDVVA